MTKYRVVENRHTDGKVSYTAQVKVFLWWKSLPRWTFSGVDYEYMSINDAYRRIAREKASSVSSRRVI